MKITQNSISHSPLVKNLQKHLQEIPFIKGFLAISKTCPNFPKSLVHSWMNHEWTKLTRHTMTQTWKAIITCVSFILLYPITNNGVASKWQKIPQLLRRSPNFFNFVKLWISQFFELVTLAHKLWLRSFQRKSCSPWKTFQCHITW
jgi:hypothetical protein